MALSGSMFLVEIIVSELRSYVKCRDFLIKSQFADVFSIILKDPNEMEKLLPEKKRIKRKIKQKKNVRPTLCKSEHNKVQSGQSVLFSNNIENLITNMKKYPIELSLWSKMYPKYKIASTNIPWNVRYIDYLDKIDSGKESEPVSITGEYNVFDEMTSRRMAVIKLNIKLSYLADKITTQFRSLSEQAPETFVYTGFNSKPSTILSTVQNKPFNLAEETGIIKTIYCGGKKKFKPSSRNKTKTVKDFIPIIDDTIDKKPSSKNIISNESTIDNSGSIDFKSMIDNKNMINKSETSTSSKQINKSIINYVKSDIDLDKSRQIDLIKCQSCSSINHLNILNYIFGDNRGPYGNQVYCVSYFTVENDPDSQSAKSSAPKSSENPDTSDKSSVKERFKFKLCDKDCPDSGDLSICSLDLPKALSDAITITKCDAVDCEHKKYRKLPTPPDDRILLDLTSLRRPCCDDTMEKVEEVTGGMIAKMQIGDDPCYCECQCKFGFTKKTRYCKVCGGYEIMGEDLGDQKEIDMPFPCPIYHKLSDKPKAKPSITSDTKKPSKAKSAAEKSIESEKESKKSKKKKNENKFKFNYGYTGIPPQIGHSRCALPCTGTLGAVPRKMGWLWSAENIPGMKFRPLWKPGAVNKHVLRKLRMASHPGEVLAKKKRKKDSGKGKRPAIRPLLVVHKKDGEYTVAMETMKTYNKPRTINQAPYEDKPPLTYTIGRTEEENEQRRLKKERAQRRLERSQRDFIQSAFRDMCKEICLKTYQQALGILPDAEDPNCTCYPAFPGPDRTDLDHSCSCSEDSNLTGSDTDSDEWIVEFTPPSATFDPTYKCKKVITVDNSTQYTYLDYRVRLLDRYGNPVPRYFKGPDGKEQCSDLGGFWDPQHKWLEINIDGFIGPDGRWAPNIFVGPNGENVDGEMGKFQAMDGTWLIVGIDGFVDAQGRWRYYPRAKPATDLKKRRAAPAKGYLKKGGAGGDRKEVPLANKKSEATWSCFGDACPKYLSELGILGHGHDRKLLLQTLNVLIAQGEDVKIPVPSVVPRSNRKKSKVKYRSDFYDAGKRKCRHPTPSNKGVVAVDEDGNKIYFKFNDYKKNKRPKQRIATLTDQGISVSSFHVPCFHSFISSEVMKKQQYDRLVALAKKRGQAATQTKPVFTPGYQHAARAEPKYRNMIV